MLKSTILLLLFMQLSIFALAQVGNENEMLEWNTKRLDRQRNFLIGLTTWGGANTVAGGIGMLTANTGSETRSFHQTNLTWGLINSALGVTSLLVNKHDRKKPFDFEDAARQVRRTCNSLLLNSGIDIGYMLAGAYIRERANRPEEVNPNRTRGVGYSFIMQGAGLLLLDVAGFYYLGKSELQITPTFTPQGAGLGFNMTF